MAIKITYHYPAGVDPESLTHEQMQAIPRTVVKRKPKGICAYCGTNHEQSLCQYAEATVKAAEHKGDI